MPASEPLFVDRISILTPPGFQARVRDAARQEGQTVSEFVRSAIRDRLPVAAPEQVSAEAG